jgi:hypothetical protein
MDARYRLLFLALSETLTGVRVSSLPDQKPPANEQPRALPGDLDPHNSPVDLASIYYEAIAVNGYEGELVALLNAFPVAGTAEEKRGFVRACFKNEKDQRTARLCNAIIKLWYLGIWYPPPLGDDSNCVPGDEKAGWKRWPSLPHEVVSMETYRSGLVWKIMRAHPMAYSTSPFGYWAEDPPPLNRFLTKA